MTKILSPVEIEGLKNLYPSMPNVVDNLTHEIYQTMLHYQEAFHDAVKIQESMS